MWSTGWYKIRNVVSTANFLKQKARLGTFVLTHRQELPQLALPFTLHIKEQPNPTELPVLNLPILSLLLLRGYYCLLSGWCDQLYNPRRVNPSEAVFFLFLVQRKGSPSLKERERGGRHICRRATKESHLNLDNEVNQPSRISKPCFIGVSGPARLVRLSS